MPKPGTNFETPTRPLQRSFVDTNDDIHTTPVEQEDEGRERQVISPLPFTPFRSSPPQHQDEQDESNPDERKKAREFARRLEHAVEVLTEVLFSYLSRLPEEGNEGETDGGGGMTLPVSAVGWLSCQLYPSESPNAMRMILPSLRDRLQLLRFLFPRVTHLRLTRQQWPPPIPEKGLYPRTPHPPPPMTFQTNPNTSVCSALTTETYQFPTPASVLELMEQLQNYPTIDLRLFRNLKVLVLLSVPPSWICWNTATKLQVLRIDRACVFSNFLSKQVLLRMTHLKLDNCGIGELTRLPSLMRRFPNLVSLSLAHNDIVLERTALRGLSALQLEKLDLSYNHLQSLENANQYLGNVQTLYLQGNDITTCQGIEKLYGLKELRIENNQIANIQLLVGLTQLPALQNLSMKGNPCCEKSYQTQRIQILSWFFEYRKCTNFKELPILDGIPVSPMEWELLQKIARQKRFVVGPTTQIPIRKIQRKHKRKLRKAVIGRHNDDLPQQQTRKNRMARKQIQQPQAVFTVQDVLSSLQKEQQEAYPEDYDDINNEDENIPDDSMVSNDTEPPLEESLQSSVHKFLLGLLESNDENEDANNANVQETEEETNVDKVTNEEEDNLMHDTEIDDVIPLQDTSTEQQLRDAVSQLSMSLCLESEPSAVHHDPSRDKEANEIVENGTSKEEPRKKVAKIKLQNGATRVFDVFSADWDDLIKLAADGLIPNGKLRTPVADISSPDQEDSIFAKAIDDVLPVEESKPITDTATLTPLASVAESLATDDATTSEDGNTQQVPMENVQSDDHSLPSSLGTNRDDFPLQSKYQLAEDNSVYYGPDAFKEKNVLKNLELYFTTFVFSDAGPSFVGAAVDYPGGDAEDEDWQSIADLCPKIQLWPEDRKSFENSTSIQSSTLTPERYVRVWEEDIVPCGKSSLSRLFPNRQARLSFHGDQLFQNGVPYAYAECRQFFVCLSSVAVYILLKNDSVTSRTKKRRFPIPMKDDASFGDAPWPHAVARHSYQDLETIAIGLEFQRLTLKFSNPRKKNDPFVYVLLISNKKETVRILQDVQRLAKESKETATNIVSDAAAVAITNDSQEVFDALNVAVAPDLIGTVMHYSIVQQRWKHGDRGTVRRVCVVTENKMFLLDEDYISDGHTTAADSNDASKAGEVRFQMVDQAGLQQVSEVQAAGADPRAITIIINPVNRLSRIHRWRLLCRDRAGAERLVDDVRKALAQAE